MTRPPLRCLSRQYSQLEEEAGLEEEVRLEEEAGLDSSSCSIEQLPLELLGKVFLHLTTKDLKVRCGITVTKIGTL